MTYDEYRSRFGRRKSKAAEAEWSAYEAMIVNGSTETVIEGTISNVYDGDYDSPEQVIIEPGYRSISPECFPCSMDHLKLLADRKTKVKIVLRMEF